MLEPMDYRPLATALRAIPVGTKEKLVEAGVVKERERLDGVSWIALIETIHESQPHPSQQLEIQLYTLLRALEVLGIVAIHRNEDWQIRATSVAASYLIQNISRLLNEAPEGSPVQPESSITPFRAIIEESLLNNAINPHLVISNIMAHEGRIRGWPPLRQHRVISVLIKGERRVKGNNLCENVYLHVYKPEWDKYALIGSGQTQGRNEKQTAMLAFTEDLANDINSVDWLDPQVADATRSELTITRGVETSYAFNLFIVKYIPDHLRLRGNRKFAWFTFDEIMKGHGRNGEIIMTNKDLMKAVDTKHNLEALPFIARADTIAEFEAPTVHLAQLRVGFASVFGQAKQYLKQFGRKWRILIRFLALFFVVIIILLLASRFFPQINRVATIAGLIAALIDIIAFILYRRHS